MRFQWWQTVLLESDSNLLRKNEFSEMYFFAIFHFFSVTFLPVARKKPILTQITIQTRWSNRLSIRMTIFRFPLCFLRVVIYY